MRLGNITKIKTGKLDANASSENGIYPFFTCARVPLKIDKYAYDCECVLVAGNGDLNVKYYSGKFEAYQRTYIIESLDKTKLSTKYLFYFLSNYIHILRTQTTGGVIKFIKLGNLTDAQIPLLEATQQQRIVSELDNIEEGIRVKEEQLKTLDELIQSRFIEMFGDPVTNPKKWDKISLGTIADVRIGPFGSLLHREDYIQNGHAVINPTHINEGKIIKDKNLTISESKYEELSPYHLLVGDVVMGRRGEMGRCAVVKEGGLLCGTGSLLIRTKGNFVPEYIQQIISFPSFKKEIERMAIGQTMLNLNVPIVSSFKIINPPRNIQEQYHTFLNHVRELKLIVMKQINDLRELLALKMDEYFR